MKKIYLFIIFFFLSATIYSQKLTRVQYIEKYKQVAQKQMRLYNIPASIIMAQACLESGNGNSTLATKANNHFGIKCHTSWKGKRYRHDDDKRRECFRKYNSPIESFEDHSIFLSTGKRYSSLFDLKITDYKAWAHGLKAAGYATNPKYAKLLIDIIETYKLYELDVPKTFNTVRKDKKAKKRYEKMQKKALKEQQKQAKAKGAIVSASATASGAGVAAASSSGAPAASSASATVSNAGSAAAVADVPNEQQNVTQTQEIQETEYRKLTKKECRLYKYSQKRDIYLENGKYFVFSLPGDTYSSLAKEYKLFTRTVVKSNNLESVDRLEPGTKVYLRNEIL